MEVVFFEQAKKDVNFWKKSGQKQIMTRITNLLNDIKNHPYRGIGKPEELKYELSRFKFCQCGIIMLDS